MEMNFDLEQAIEVLSATPGTLRSLLGRLSADWTAGDHPVRETRPPLLKPGGEPDAADHPVRETRPPLLKPGGELEAATFPLAGEETKAEWQPYDVVGHLIHGEETDWIPRARIILEQGEDRTFVPFDRFAQFERSEGKSLDELLDEFAALRAENLETLRAWNLTSAQLDLRGMHPELGESTLRQLLATWVVHDLNHIRQIVTAMAGRYGGEVGPWREYLSILK